MPTVTTYLEMRSPRQLRPKWCADERFQIREKIERDWRFNRDLYLAVGQMWSWEDKRVWSDDEGGVEIAYFGLLPEFIGRGLGGALLTSAIEEAWRTSSSVSRVWVHTCTLDHPGALGNYQARGMVIYKQETTET